MALSEGERVRMKFDHVSIAVRSIDSARGFFARYFPITPRTPRTLDDQVSGKFYYADFSLGGFIVEMIEDLPEQPSFVTRFIERRGEGLHHLSIEVDNLEPILRMLKADGVRVADEQGWSDGSRTAFISPRSAFGTLIQFWQPVDYEAHTARPAPDGRAHFDHVSIAVRDIRRAMAFFGRYFGGRATHEPHISGSRGDFVLGHMEVADFKLEFIQSPGHTVNDDFVARFISRFGEGMHHISIDLKDFDGTLQKLRADGIRVVDESVNWRGQRQFFVSPRSSFGVLIQVWDGM